MVAHKNTGDMSRYGISSFESVGAGRWICAWLGALLMLAGLGLLLGPTDYTVKSETSPRVVHLDMIELIRKQKIPTPPQTEPIHTPEAEPPATRSEPKPEDATAEDERIQEEPKHDTAPIAAADNVPGDIIGSGPAQPAAPRQVAPTRIQSAEELDNVEFDPIFNPKPPYPPVARKAGIEGWVDVDLIVNESGRVDSFEIDSVFGHPQFAAATGSVLPRWRFPPPRRGGKNLKVRYYYRINFLLR